MELLVDAPVVISFMRDLLRLNFGSDAPFVRDYGEDGRGYIEWLRVRLSADQRTAALACTDSVPVGMAVTGRWRVDPSIGYVNQYYLTSTWRGQGLGRQLDDYAMSVLQAQGFRSARLTASATNAAALRFYSKVGWLDAGPRPDVPGTIYMTKNIPVAAL